jgi:hypothetical protein
MLPLVYPEVATREMGSPPRIHASQPAQPIVTLDMARTTTVGPALWTFHTQVIRGASGAGIAGMG